MGEVDLNEWVGRTTSVQDVVGPTPVVGLSATLDHPPREVAVGSPLPPLWHWLYFLPVQRQSELGPDGHPRRGGFLPPVELPRRMWAGGRFVFHAPLLVGDAVVRTSTIEDVVAKEGRTGPLVFVTVRHEVHRDGGRELALVEHHDIVYRGERRPDDVEPPPTVAPTGAAWQRRIVADEVLLFRYSALIFNGHRIHYDRRYVTEVEGYSGLVVHGPLLATLLLDLLHRHAPDADVAGFRFRAIRPTFDLHPFHVNGEPGDDYTVRLWAQDHDGLLTMDAVATLR
jgi:3-methylfumaryl-CoA hydratase